MRFVRSIWLDAGLRFVYIVVSNCFFKKGVSELFSEETQFQVGIVCVMYKSLGGRLRSMDVSGFEGKSKIICDDSIMMFNAHHPGVFPQLSMDVNPLDEYDDSTCCSKYSHNIGCFTYGPVLSLLSGITAVVGCVGCPFAFCGGLIVTEKSCLVNSNTIHWMRAAPCFGT